jgi:ribonuclease J
VTDLVVTPLGGCGEVGLNATLIEDGEDAILIDCGVLLSVPDAPGVDRLMIDFSVLEKPGRKLHGLVVTHGHEDHIGAIPELMRAIDLPVYGPPLALMLLESRLEAEPSLRKRLFPVSIGSRMVLGPFGIELIRVTHSMPDSAALFIETRSGRIFHSGDFKLDSTPMDGLLTDVDRLRAIGDLGIDLALVDSTNSERNGHTRSEREVAFELERIALETEGRLVIACFASHLHRLEGIARAAKKSGRRVALFGRSLHRSWEIGTASGHLSQEAVMIEDESQLDRIDSKKMLLVVTGSQGEPRAALAKIAFSPTRALSLGRGDRLVFSATAIPGNERAIRRLVNAISATGAEVIQDGMRPVHCSGHAHKEEQIELLEIIRPKRFVPVHGERAMLEAHAKTARQRGVAEVLVIEDGASAVISGGRLLRGPVIDVPRRAFDAVSGKQITWHELRTRKKIGAAGLVICSLAIDAAGEIAAEPVVSFAGVAAASGLEGRIAERAKEAFRDGLRDDALARALRRVAKDVLGIKPLVEVHLIRVPRRSVE